MSIALMTGVFRLPPGQPGLLRHRMVLLALADSANDEGVCWPKQTTLAAKCGISVATIKRVLTELRETGWLIVEQTYRDDGGKSVCRYRVTLDPIAQQRTDPPLNSELSHSSTVSYPLRSTVSYQEPSVVEPSVEPSRETRTVANYAACTALSRSLIARGYSAPISNAWLQDMDRLHRIDGRSYEDIDRVIRWLDNGRDPVALFWRTNVRSPGKLRAHWNVMREQYAAQIQQDRRAGRSNLIDALADL